MFDEGQEDDVPDQGPLLPPEDRLWRHPSEVGAARADDAPAASSAASVQPGRRFPWGLSLLSAVAGATAAIGVVLIAGGLSGQRLQRPVGDAVSDTTPPTVSASVRPGSVAEIADRFSPALARLDLPGDASATAVLFDDDGLLLTTAHGLADAETVPVVLADGERLDGDVVGVDHWTDLAVVAVAHDGEPAPLGSSAQVAVGDAALVMAAPLGDGRAPTVTVGVVSALEQAMASGSHTLRGLIRADAGVATTATGGALLDEDGELVGIVTVPTDGELAGVGYAVPVDLARQVALDLVDDGRASHVWLGIEGNDGASPAGVVVDRVADDGPAAAAGLGAADLIVAVDGEPVASMADLVAELREHEPGDAVVVDYRRGDAATRATVTLAERS